MNSLDTQYQDLLKSILDYGVYKKDRTGTGTKSIFGYTIRHSMKNGFPLLTTKKMAWKSIVTELIWFLKGDTNIKFLLDNNCNIWNGDAYKRYYNDCMHSADIDPMPIEEFIKQAKSDKNFSYNELGPIYGKQWRKWQGWLEDKETKRIIGSLWYDQIQRLLTDLKRNPDSRRLMVNAWNVSDLDKMVLPPCHYGFQVYTRLLTPHERLEILQEKGGGRLDGTPLKSGYEDQYEMFNIPTRAISLMWNQRSVDAFLGLPFNIASYGLLLSLLAKEVNMVPEDLIGNLGDTHLYLNHLEQAEEQIGREYTPEERNDMLKEVMGEEKYSSVVSDIMPFGGGLSEYYQIYKIPRHTKEAYKLPTLNLDFEYTYFDGYLVEWEKIPMDKITVENYKHHSTIKAPLSN